MTDTELNEPMSVNDFFEIKKKSLDVKSAAEYHKAVVSFNAMSADSNSFMRNPDRRILADWFIGVMHNGQTLKTTGAYLNALASIYKTAVTECGVPQTDVFKSFRQKLRQFNPGKPENRLSGEDFKRFSDQVKRSEGDLTADLIRMSLLNGAMPPTEVAMLKKESLDPDKACHGELIQKYADGRRRYLFPLDQSARTPRQLERHISGMIARFCSQHNLRYFGSAESTLKTYWAYGALDCGVMASEVMNALNGTIPPGIPELELADISPAKSDTASEAVANLFCRNKKNWYAMRLRPAVRFKQLQSRLAPESNSPQIFYPCDEIAMRIGKKLTFKPRPVIPDVVFFRTRPTEIYPLFLKIGDLAWCYRQGASYAPIPDVAMSEFQETIGHFTDDYEVAPIGELPPQPSERLKIVGGLFEGHTGAFNRIENAETGTIYRMTIMGDNGFDWRIKVDRRLVTRK